MAIFVEDWQATDGAPYLVQADDDDDTRAVLIEDEAEHRCHHPSSSQPRYPIDFVDGVRRAALYQHDNATGIVARASREARPGARY